MEERKYLDSAQQPSAVVIWIPNLFVCTAIKWWTGSRIIWAHVGDYPVLAQTAPGDIRQALP